MSRRRTLIAAAAATALLAAGAVVATNALDNGRILAGVRAGGVPLGGLSEDEAAARLEQEIGGNRPSVTIELPGRNIELEAKELGWRIDSSATARLAMLSGREQGVLAGIARRLSPGGEVTIQPVSTVDEKLLRQKLSAIGASLARPAENARVVFRGGRYGVRYERPGQRLDVESAVQAYTSAPGSTSIRLAAVAVPASVRGQDLESVVATANTLLRPLKLVYVAPATTREGTQIAFSNTLSPTQVADLFFVRQDGIEIDEKTTARAVARLADSFDRQPVNARYKATGAGPTDLQRVPEAGGWRLDQRAARLALAERVQDPQVSAVLLDAAPAEPTVRLVDLPDPATLSVISEGTTSFRGSSRSRATNVLVAARRLDGAVIPAGAEFSFNDTIGSIALENGFKAALVISNGRTVEGVGGGVCQVSTTAFRALYRAGFPILERNQHAYRVHWYDPEIGFDAAVYQPVLDLKATNDLSNPVLLRSIVDEEHGTLTVRVYGIPEQRTVVISDPVILSHTPHPPAAYEYDASLPPGARRQVDWAADGYKIRITRKVFDSNGVRSDELLTDYKPWRAVYQLGPRRD